MPLRANAPAYANPTFLATQGIPPLFALGTSAVYPFNYPIPAVPAGVPDSHGAYSGFPTANIGGTDPNLHTPLIVNYTAGIERQLGRHITVGANYGGSFANNLPEGDVNTITPNNDINRVTGSYIANKNKLVRPLTSFGAINYTRNGNQCALQRLHSDDQRQVRIARYLSGVLHAFLRDRLWNAVPRCAGAAIDLRGTGKLRHTQPLLALREP